MSFGQTTTSHPGESVYQYTQPIAWTGVKDRSQGMILSADAVRTESHSALHRLWAKAEWCLVELHLTVFGPTFAWVREGSVMRALDDTLARKRVLKVHEVGMHHDPMISTRKVAWVNWAHGWVVLGTTFVCLDGLAIMANAQGAVRLGDYVTARNRHLWAGSPGGLFLISAAILRGCWHG